MKPATRVQIPEKAIGISLHANALGKDVNLSILSTVINQ